ncbi:hypothetical protein FWG95_03735 [Candidatus Saccharibacteria bacterium]|nr:hypothetical protein [Candidatus Saccharibacteria bacterium]
MVNHIIIYSHGFGVKYDDRGLFTDIAAAFSDTEHIMFNYNDIDEANNTMTARPFDKQAQILTEVFEKVRHDNSTATIDLICHSQGCITAALAELDVRRTIFLTPPMRVFSPDSDIFIKYPATTDEDGTMHWPRRDGTTTIIGPDYWQSSSQLGGGIVELYNRLAQLTKLSVIGAGQDEILGPVDYAKIDKNIGVALVDEADHNFKGESRTELIGRIEKIIT